MPPWGAIVTPPIVDFPRRRLLAGMLGGAALLAAPQIAMSALAAPAALPVLKVGDQRGNVQALLTAAGVLDELPYRIEWPEFVAAAPLLEAVNAGALDLGFAGDAPFAFAAAAGTPMKAVAAFEGTMASAGDDEDGGLAILVKKDSAIRSLADLRGKQIATTRGSVGHFLVLYALSKAGIAASDVTFAFLLPQDGKSALEGGWVDAWSTWDPYVATAQLEGGTRSLVNGRSLYAGFGFLIASDEAIRTKRALIEDFIPRQRRAFDWRGGHVADFAKIFSTQTGLPPRVAELMVAHTQYRPVPIDDRVIRTVQSILDLYAENHVIPASRDVSAAFDRSFQA